MEDIVGVSLVCLKGMEDGNKRGAKPLRYETAQAMLTDISAQALWHDVRATHARGSTRSSVMRMLGGKTEQTLV